MLFVQKHMFAKPPAVSPGSILVLGWKLRGSVSQLQCLPSAEAPWLPRGTSGDLHTEQTPANLKPIQPNAELSNSTQLQRDRKAPNTPSCSSNSSNAVWGVCCPFGDQMLHIWRLSTSARHSGEVKNYGINRSGIDALKV